MKQFFLAALLALTSFAAQAQEYKLYYFYSNMRCTTCLRFEQWTTDIAANLPVSFKTINIDDKQNSHYIKTYSLYTKSVVITNEQGKFKNLDKIWELSRNEEMFKNYISNQVSQFIKDNP